MTNTATAKMITTGTSLQMTTVTMAGMTTGAPLTNPTQTKAGITTGASLTNPTVTKAGITITGEETAMMIIRSFGTTFRPNASITPNVMTSSTTMKIKMRAKSTTAQRMTTKTNS